MGRRMKCDLLFVNSFRDRHGHWRYYFRRKGLKRVTLPGLPGSEEFLRAYNDCRERKEPPRELRSTPGTLNALREEYIASADFSGLAPSTQSEMRYVLDALCLAPNRKTGGTRGECQVKTLRRKNIMGWRDAMKAKPGAANKMIRVVKQLMTFAMDREYRDDNPALRIKMFKLGEFRDWTDAELVQFEARWPLGTMERTAYALALYSGQRRADLANMKWSDIAGDAIMVRQAKTGTVLRVEIHPALQEAIQAVNPRRGETIITGDRGHKLNAIYFGKLMADAIAQAGLPDDCVLHGLRKTHARSVAEVGGNVSSTTGHLTDAMARKYSRRADQTRNAKAAILAWAKRDRKAKNKAGK